jgi:hypothetical protein
MYMYRISQVMLNILRHCLDLGAGRLHRHSIVRLRFFVGGLFERGTGGGRILKGRGENHSRRLPTTCMEVERANHSAWIVHVYISISDDGWCAPFNFGHNFMLDSPPLWAIFLHFRMYSIWPSTYIDFVTTSHVIWCVIYNTSYPQLLSTLLNANHCSYLCRVQQSESFVFST